MRKARRSVFSGLVLLGLLAGSPVLANPIPCQLLHATRVGADVELSFEIDRACFEPAGVPDFTVTAYRDGASIDLSWTRSETVDQVIYSATETDAPEGYHCYRVVASDGQGSIEDTACVGTPPPPDGGVPDSSVAGDAGVEQDADPDDDTVGGRNGCAAAGRPVGGFVLLALGLWVLCVLRRNRR